MIIKRIVRLDPKSFELAYEAAAAFRAPKEMEDAHADLMERLDAAGEAKPGPTPVPEMTLRTAPANVELEMPESERDVLFAAVNAISWPGYALRFKRALVALLKNAERVEAT